MRTFSIILVDDEKQILQGMLHGVPWEELGYQVIATADNGQEALELTQLHHPDLLISDIKMPFMTGIELAKHIHEDFMQVKMVLFSGFDEFEYARSAIHYGVSEYLLKPIDYPEMSALLQRMHDELEQEYDARIDRERQKRIYQESLPFVRQRYFMQLLRSGKNKEDILQQLQRLDVSFDMPCMQVLIVSIPEPEGDFLTAISVEEMLTEMLEKVGKFYSVRYFDRLIYIFCLEAPEKTGNIVKSMNETARMAEKIFHSSFSCGMSSVIHRPEELPLAYQQAKEALEYNLVSEDECMTLFSDLLYSEEESRSDWQQESEDLEYSIKHGNEEDVRREVQQLLGKIQSCHYSFNEYQMAIIQIVFALAKLYRRYEIEDEEGMAGSKHMAVKLFSFQDGSELNNWLLHYCMYTNHAIREREVDQSSILARQAKEYVDSHYSDPELSVDTVCQMLHISASHFSKVFRKAYGTGFLSYITDKRMEEAEHLLLTTEYKSREIGEMVGYLEPNYFSYVFKKNRNVSPAKYRKLRREHEGDNGES